MFSRLTVIYFAFSFIHFAIQLGLQIRAFTINAGAASFLGDLVARGEATTDWLPILRNGNISVCNWVSSTLDTDVETCQLVWAARTEDGATESENQNSQAGGLPLDLPTLPSSSAEATSSATSTTLSSVATVAAPSSIAATTTASRPLTTTVFVSAATSTSAPNDDEDEDDDDLEEDVDDDRRRRVRHRALIRTSRVNFAAPNSVSWRLLVSRRMGRLGCSSRELKDRNPLPLTRPA